ncbi:SDR family NAD(P)-dependent oxidoreductase [Roseibacterium sp. SDUM158017]|uniref:SDR family NAD(P)-dependent oxidoreductase n=1 Tax=Roseicyclus salinarum TaxID=3036773 RepID=UPI0024152B93|nr:SDR family oxidoreductase [Roseibacterium sp. SDUM158017]MDG4650012.1 SDR family NAD(P)-dependent oxidoreductase [Roseibacterium sp. SDUM158017]
MDKPLQDRVALVTGASRGLGAACAEWLAGQGAHVVAVARTVGALEEVDDRIQAAGGHATLAPIDLTDDAAIAHLCRSIHDRWGRADIWVHAAVHVTALTPAPHVTAKDLDRNIATNIRMTARLIAMVDPLIAPSDMATAVFFDDDWDEKYAGAYAMSKAAQRALVRCWQAETARHAPDVHLLRPAPMPTATRARFYPGEDKTALAHPREEAARLLGPIFA